MSSLSRAFLALALVAGARSTDAQAPLDIRALGAPSFESFSARDGLPEGVLVGIAVDAEGVAWAASPKGLYRFLGHRWERQVGPTHGTVYHRLLLDHAGTLWAASNDKDVSLHDTGGWHFLGRTGGIPAEVYGAAEVLDTMGQPHTWLLTGASGIVERRGDRWVPDPGNASIPRAAFLTSARATRHLFGEPRQWIGSGDAGLLYRREGDTAWRRFQLPGFVVGQVEDIRTSVDEHGEALWVSSFGQGIYRIDSRGVRRWSIASNELLSNEVYSIAISTGGGRGVTAWVGSRRGLIRIHGDVAETFDRRYGLPSDQVRDVYLWRSPSGEDTQSTSLVFIDVDHFKGINDRLGHPAGDEVLRSIATTLQACTPATVLITRYGGEEFACLLPGVPLEDALVIAERMRAEVEARPIPVPGWPEDVHATISAGVGAVALQSEDDMHQLLRVADLALYRAKDEGRNRVRT
ncbi:hypothetical protein BH11GEM2_BH11GEM2_15820 [soil metagenome]